MAKVYKITDDGSVSVDKTVDSVVEKMTTGVSAIFAKDSEKAYSADIVRWGMVTTNVANTIATSIFTRKRAAQGKKPIAKFLF